MISALRILLLVAVFGTWIPCLKAQDNDSITCLSNRRLDYLLFEQANASFLRNDTSLKAGKIKDLNRIILKQTDTQTKTESILKLKDLEIKDQNKSFDEVLKRFNKEQSKVKLWRTGSLVFGSSTIILIGLILALNK